MRSALLALLTLLPGTSFLRAASFETSVEPFIAKNCYGCHNEKTTSGGLDLKAVSGNQAFVKSRETWERALAKVKSGEMPPKGVPRPPAESVQGVVSWLETEFARMDREAPVDPGRVTMRRLNRYEYNATVRDLLGVDFRPADDFPADDFAYGFDNIGDVLTLSPALMEKYITAAKKIARLAIEAPPAPKTPLVDHHKNLSEAWPFIWNRKFSWAGDYEVRFSVPYSVDGRHDPGTIFISIDGGAPQSYPLATEYSNEGRYQEVKLHLSYGLHELKGWAERDDTAVIKTQWEAEQKRQERRRKLLETEKSGNADPSAVLFGDRAPNAAADGGGRKFTPPPDLVAKRRAETLAPPLTKEDLEKKIAGLRQPYIEAIEVHGPYNPQSAPAPETYHRVFICGHTAGHHTEACLRGDLADLARRAWRRPPTDSETAKLMSFVRMSRAQGDSVDDAMRVGVMAVLVSPNFLFRVERTAAGPGPAKRLGDFELASRLSYFLWSTMPDEELFSLAKQGRLSESGVLDEQVRRMLKSPKADALVDNFGGQWLLVRNLDSLKPDPDKFPLFNGALRAAMKEETHLFFTNIVRDDRPITDFLTARYTYVNEALAKLYGIPGVTGGEFRKVDLEGTPRVGILTQASVLTVSSYPTRTSPVIRGKWILDNLLNAPPPPPPADVPSLDATAVGTTASLREQLEKHRANAVCASCHSKMDPLGFGLENFDAIGRWRTMDGKFPIDSKGTLPNGKSFSSPTELAGVLAEDKQAFTRCLTEKFMTFALGRGLEPYDRPAVNKIVQHQPENEYRFSGLILDIVHSAPFQMRRGEIAKPALVAKTATHIRSQGALR